MRVIAGKLGGRRFEAPKGHKTHPMSDKMRGAVFSVLGNIEGLTMLDAFAGSGAMVFEAISRGAKSAIAIEVDKAAVDTIRKNAASLGIVNELKMIRANASGWSDNNKDMQFDLVICDPPYDRRQLSLLQKLVKHTKANGIYVLSWPGKLEVPEFTSLEKLQNKNYGDSQLVFYRKIG